jgi:hypothetical protein
VPHATQTDLVQASEPFGDRGQVVTDRISVPGLEDPDAMTRKEISDILANVFKSRRDVVKLVWQIETSHIEVSYRVPTA